MTDDELRALRNEQDSLAVRLSPSATSGERWSH